jgi:endonuclease YncB( thermonuclease family)
VGKAKVFGGLVGIWLVVASCNAITGHDDKEPVSQTGGASTARYAAPAAVPAATPTLDPAKCNVVMRCNTNPVGEVITVKQVIDGETFETTDGRTIRVLGIDSCEMNTYGGGDAKIAAEGQLLNQFNDPITIAREPGVDRDERGRLLRYVQLDGSDMGEYLVKYDHTGVDQGKNGASPEYIHRLYAHDTEYSMNPPSGRECADPYAEYRDGSSSDIDVYVNNDDSDDGESRFCSRRWWC